jgi:putative acetyltransferase
MLLQNDIHTVTTTELPQVVDVWEASIREAHGLVSDAYLRFFKPLVHDELLRTVDVSGVRDASGVLTGFIATAGEKIEALFVHPRWRRRGIARRLVRHAVACGAATVDLDAHNVPAIRLFEGLDFRTEARWDVVSLGKTFPMVRLRLRR